jgi:hypothetical protein
VERSGRQQNKLLDRGRSPECLLQALTSSHRNRRSFGLSRPVTGMRRRYLHWRRTRQRRLDGPLGANPVGVLPRTQALESRARCEYIRVGIAPANNLHADRQIVGDQPPAGLRAEGPGMCAHRWQQMLRRASTERWRSWFPPSASAAGPSRAEYARQPRPHREELTAPEPPAQARPLRTARRR